MLSFKWLGFGVSNSLTKTVVHFFPSAGNVTAPYPAQCKLTVFGQGLQRRSVMLEGARFSQPDGVRVDAAFPALQEGLPGLFGLIVEITSTQPRVDLSASSCIVEFVSAAPSVKYVPRAVLGDEPVSPEYSTALGIRDAFNVSSVVVVNASYASYSPKLTIPGVQMDFGGETVGEIELQEALFRERVPSEASFGLCRTLPISVSADYSAETAYFMMYRDSATKRPVSVTVFPN